MPESTGKLFLVDPVTDQIAMIPVPFGAASADAKGTFAYVADRANDQIAIVDTVAGAVVGTAQLGSTPDYVRASPTTGEVWVSLPGAGRIDILSITGGELAASGSVSIGEPTRTTAASSSRSTSRRARSPGRGTTAAAARTAFRRATSGSASPSAAVPPTAALRC